MVTKFLPIFFSWSERTNHAIMFQIRLLS
jgi:hypothetical protein